MTSTWAAGGGFARKTAAGGGATAQATKSRSHPPIRIDTLLASAFITLLLLSTAARRFTPVAVDPIPGCGGGSVSRHPRAVSRLRGSLSKRTSNSPNMTATRCRFLLRAASTRLAPVPLDPVVTAVVMGPVAIYPHGVRVAPPLPPAWRPHVVICVVPIVAVNPNELGSGRGSDDFDLGGGRPR